MTGGPARIEKGSIYQVTARGPLGLKGGTFTELELGVEPIEARRGIQGRAIGALHAKSFLRRATEKALDGLRRAVGHPATR